MSDAIREQERLEWGEYAAPRFRVGGVREQAARRRFLHDCEQWHARLRPAWSLLRLRLEVLRALEKPCTYCVESFGLRLFGLSQDDGRAVVCCLDCAEGKRDMSRAEWLDVLAAVRAADPHRGSELVAAIVAGRKVRRGEASAKVLPPPPPTRVTRERRLGSSKQAKK